MKPLPELAPVLKEALAAKGYLLSDAAGQIGAGEANLRQWFSRNRFPREMLAQLTQLAAMPASLEELGAQYEFGLSQPKRDPARAIPINAGAEGQKFSLGQTLRFFDQRLEALDPSGRLYDNFGQDVESAFRSMGKNDVFVFWAIDQMPFEMRAQNGVAREEVAAAVKQGAFFVYLYPSAELLDMLEKDSDVSVPSRGHFEKDFAGYLRLLETEDVFTTDEDRKKVRTHVIKVRASGPAFASPYHRFVLFFPASRDGARGFARFPTGNENKPKELHLSLSPDVTGQLLRFARKSLIDADKDVPSRSELLKLVK